MEPHAILLLMPALGVVCGTILVGIKMLSSHQLKMREAPGGDTERLVEAIHQLHDEIGSMREDIAEVQERLDFTERVLSEVKSRDAIGPGDST
jgi:hypothetical protein